MAAVSAVPSQMARLPTMALSCAAEQFPTLFFNHSPAKALRWAGACTLSAPSRNSEISQRLPMAGSRSAAITVPVIATRASAWQMVTNIEVCVSAPCLICKPPRSVAFVGIAFNGVEIRQVWFISNRQRAAVLQSFSRRGRQKPAAARLMPVTPAIGFRRRA